MQRPDAFWGQIRARFIIEHGMSMDEYGCRYGVLLEWLKKWWREVEDSIR